LAPDSTTPLQGQRILIIVQNLPVPFDRRVWLEATTLRRLGAEVTVICPKGRRQHRESRLELEGVRIRRYRAFQASRSPVLFALEFLYCWLRTFWISLGLFARRRFQVIHACNPPETYFLLARFYKLFGVRFVFDHHDLSPEMYLAKYDRRPDRLYRMLLFLERCTFRAADGVIATNESHRRIARERGGVAPERVFVVRSGPDLDRLREYPPDAGYREGQDHLVCYLGEMCAQDGVDMLLRAVRCFIEDLGRRDTQFILVGGGPEQPALVEYARELGIQDRVRFTGRVSDDDLCRILSSADVCVDPDPPNDWSDKSTMNKIMEYMFFRKPIVAFDLAENRFSAGEAAVLVREHSAEALAAAVTALLDDEPRRRRMGAAGRLRLERELAWQHSVPHLRRAYETVCDLVPAGPPHRPGDGAGSSGSGG